MITVTNSRHTPLFYEQFGDASKPAIVLLPGLGSQGISWSDSYCLTLSNLGFFVLRLDNRDSGKSTIFDEYPIPDLQLMQKFGPVDIPYNLEDMARDVALTLEQAGINKAHIIGRSMGGIIAQIFAAIYADKTLSLCVIMSTTGNSELSPPKPDLMAMLLGTKPDPKLHYKDYELSSLQFLKRLCGDLISFDEEYYRHYIKVSFDRQYSPAGTLRQIAAIVGTGDIRQYLKNIIAPTLILHGENDPMFDVDAAKDIKRNIHGAELQIIKGMGHEIPLALEATIIELIRPYLEGGKR